MSVLGEAHQTVIDSLDFTRSRAEDPSEVWSKDKEKKEEHRTTKNCGENENGKQQQRQRQQVEQGGEEEERGPSLEDIKRALRQNFRDTGVVDDVTVRTALLLYIKRLYCCTAESCPEAGPTCCSPQQYNMHATRNTSIISSGKACLHFWVWDVDLCLRYILRAWSRV